MGPEFDGPRPGPGHGPNFDKGLFDGRPERCPKFDVLSPSDNNTALAPARV